jgi:hypothetical protein
LKIYNYHLAILTRHKPTTNCHFRFSQTLGIDLSTDAIIKAGHAAQTTTAIEEITGRKPILFSQFAKDYAGALA